MAVIDLTPDETEKETDFRRSSKSPCFVPFRCENPTNPSVTPVQKKPNEWDNKPFPKPCEVSALNVAATASGTFSRTSGAF